MKRLITKWKKTAIQKWIEQKKWNSPMPLFEFVQGNPGTRFLK